MTQAMVISPALPFRATQIELDFGTTVNQTAKTFTIADAKVSATSLIVMVQALDAPTGKDQDENEMDAFNIRCVAAAGSFDAYVESLCGAVRDNFKFNYIIG